MKILLLAIFCVFILSCATQEGIVVKDEPLRATVPVTAPASPPQKVIYVEKEKIVQVKDPHSVKIKDLSWSTSHNWNRIQTSPELKFIFDLGVAFQIGIADGFGGRRTTKEERIDMYPIMREYSGKDEIKLLDLNVAYDGGFEMAMKYIKDNNTLKAEKIESSKPQEDSKNTTKAKTGK